jgi:hypothetical protein
MKQNRKNKTLSFIRFKNEINKGKEVFVNLKISSVLMMSSKHSDKKTIALQESIKREEQICSKRFKIQMRESSFYIGYSGDDFINNICTVRIGLKKI